ncbi:MAG: PorT family protein [Acidobacteriales bacterium]|nr:PorT family protein [Terriglobales bacterium]
MRNLIAGVLLLAVACTVLSAPAAVAAKVPSIEFGLKAGVPLTALMTAASNGYEPRTRRYTLGPTLELKLPYKFSFEVDLLYKRMAYLYPGPISRLSTPAVAGRWELPVLAKYRFTAGRCNPFMTLGGSWNRVTGSHSMGKDSIGLRHRSVLGLAIGFGVERRFGPIRVMPEVRFTHWTDRNFGVRDAALRSNLNQTEFLAGFTF